MTSKAPSPRSSPSSVAGIVASCAGMVRPSTQASSAVVVGAATSLDMGAYLGSSSSEARPSETAKTRTASSSTPSTGMVTWKPARAA